MAWIFSLSIECGIAESDAKFICQYFEGLIVKFKDGQDTTFSTHILIDGEKNYWAVVSSRHIKVGGSDSPVLTDSQYTSEAGWQLYKKLKAAPVVFRYALVGWEVEEFRTFSQLDKEDLELGVFPGLVISNEIWERFGKPSHFEPFNESHFWQIYQGELVSY